MMDQQLKNYCFALDLKDDKKLIQEYKNYHQALPIARKGEKWLLMEKMFQLD
jgi:hypothetical protein